MRVNMALKYFSSVKKIPDMRRYGELKFNYKNFIQNLPVHFSNVSNRKCDADPQLVASFYEEYLKKSNDINLMRRQLNLMKERSAEIKRNGGDILMLLKDIKKHNDDIQKFGLELQTIEMKLMDETLRIPNSTCPDSPVGAEEMAVVVKTVGVKFFYI